MRRSKLPMQAAPVERTITGTPLSTESGVDPSFLGGLAATLLPIAAKGIASLF